MKRPNRNDYLKPNRTPYSDDLEEYCDELEQELFEYQESQHMLFMELMKYKSLSKDGRTE